MTATIIDGKAIAAELRAKVAAEVRAALHASTGRDAGPRGRAGRQQSGERSLCRQQGEGDRRGRHAVLRPQAAGQPSSEAELLALIAQLNADPAVHGILVQLPLPPQIDAQRCSTRSIRARTSTAFIRSMPGGLRPACRRWCRARRSAASSWPRLCMPRSRAWRRW